MTLYNLPSRCCVVQGAALLFKPLSFYVEKSKVNFAFVLSKEHKVVPIPSKQS